MSASLLFSMIVAAALIPSPEERCELRCIYNTSFLRLLRAYMLFSMWIMTLEPPTVH
jgi:hypothetical protein